MRRMNGNGGVVYLGGNRRKPYAAKITDSVSQVVKNGTVKYKQTYKYIGYFETKEEAEACLDKYIEADTEGKAKILKAKKTKHSISNDLAISSEDRARLCNTLSGMKDRCYNPEADAYKYYGAKGVRICDAWLEDSTNFYLWSMSHGYMNGLSIDRIDPRGDYEPSNCRWTDSVVQGINRRAKHDDCYTCMFRNSYINNLHATCYERVMELREKNISEEESESC